MKLTEAQVYKALKRVIDPEVGFSVVDMGLVYGVRIKGFDVEVKMTLTSPGCPLASMIEEMVKDEVRKVKGVKRVKFILVWDPVWDPSKMSPEIRAEMGYD